jgi:hypothetical protein
MSAVKTGSNNPMYGVHRFGEESSQWKGEDVKYRQLHRWVRKFKPKPLDSMCEICHKVSWFDTASINGIYNRDFKNWKFLCRSCHLKIDKHYAGLWWYERKSPPNLGRRASCKECPCHTSEHEIICLRCNCQQQQQQEIDKTGENSVP